MSTFTRDAAEMLRAAEAALSGKGGGGRYPTRQTLSPFALYNPNYGNLPLGRNNKENAPDSPGGYQFVAEDSVVNENDARMLEVLRQLQVALSEIASLRSELSVEKEARSQALVALGRRWKDELMVELRSGDFQLHRDVAEVQYQVGEKLKELTTQNALLRRQVEELQRGAKARDSTQFDRLEHVQEELDGLRTKCDAAMAQSATTRVECAEQLERERSALSHRLDTELVRFADMRRDEQKELRIAKEYIREEVQKVGGTVRDMVEAAWRSCAAALEASTKDAADTTKADLKHIKLTVQSMEEKVEHCVRTCQGEARLLGASLKDRLSALEANEAVTASRVDRAEKKSDAAHDATSRMDAAFLTVKETVDRATTVAKQAATQAQRAEDALLDRDARLAQVESQLQAAASSEKLKAEIEACKRTMARVESQTDALSRVCERSEELAEKTARSNESAADRVVRCERLVEKSHEMVKGFAEAQQQWAQRLVAVEDLRDRVVATSEQQELTAARLEQRVVGGEGKVKLLAERLSQATKDLQHQQLGLATQLEGAQESVSRSEAVSALAKTEVERLEKRLLQLESASAGVVADCTTTRATVEENTKDVDLLRRQMQQARELNDVRSGRVDEKLASFDKLESTITEKMAKVERNIGKHLDSMNQQAANTAEQLEATLQESFSRFQSHVEKEINRNVGELRRRMSDVGAESRASKHVEALEASVADLQKTLHDTNDRVAALQSLQSAVAKLESHTRTGRSEVSEQLHEIKEDCDLAVQQVRQRHEAELNRLQRRLQAVEEKVAVDDNGVKTRTQELTQQFQTLDTRVSTLSDTVANSLIRVAPGSSTATSAGGAATQSGANANANLHGTPALGRTKLSTVGDSAAAETSMQSLDVPLPAAQGPATPSALRPQGARVVLSTTPPAQQTTSESVMLRASGEDMATRISGISPVRASLGATAATSPDSSLAHALEAPRARGVAGPSATSKGRLFDSAHVTPTASTSRSRSQGEEEGSQPSSSSGLPPPVPTKTAKAETPMQQPAQEPKHLPPPTAPPPSVDATLLGGGSTVGQRTIISRFVPLNDEVTATSTLSEGNTPHPVRRRAEESTGEDRTDDISTSLTTSPHRTPSGRDVGSLQRQRRRSDDEERVAAAGRGHPSLSEAWVPAVASPKSASTDNDNTAATRTVEKQQRPQDESGNSPLAEHPSAVGGAAGRGVVSSGERADPPQASANRFDNWDDEDENSDEDENPAVGLPMGRDSDESGDAVLPMDTTVATPPRQTRRGAADADSPDPKGPQAAAALRATPRKDFLGGTVDIDEDALDKEEVPRHGQATTSSSATGGSRSSGSAARASAGSHHSQPVEGQGWAARPAKKYGSFDDSSSSDEDL